MNQPFKVAAVEFNPEFMELIRTLLALLQSRKKPLKMAQN
jgi:hypothetical protein